MKKKPIQVLLIEDNPGDARLFREYLHETDLFQVELEHVESLKTGLEHLTRGETELILLDLGLPDSQGLKTFTQVFADAPEVPIVVLTGLDDANQAVDAVKAGAQDYLVKGEVSGSLLARSIRYAIERKQTEEALRRSEARAYAMLRAIPDLMFRMDRQSVFLDYKADRSNLYAQSEPTIIGKSNRDIAPPEFSDLIDGQIRTALKTGTLQTFEYQLPIPGQGMRNYEARMIASSTDEVTAIVRDVTENKQAEDALRESEEKYRAVVDKASDGIMIGQDGIMRFSNSSFAAMLGYDVIEVEGTEFSRIIPPENLGFFMERHQKRLAGEQVPAIYETSLLHRNGARIPIEVNASIIQYEGKPADLVIMRNISERKRADEELRRREQEFITLAENIPDLLVRFDTHLRHLYVNPVVEQVAGISRVDYLGKTNEELGMLPEQVAFWNRELSQVIEEAAPREFSFYFTSADGLSRYFEAHVRPEFDLKGQVVSLLSLVRDITKQKQFEATLQEYSTRLEADVAERTRQLREAQEQLVRQEKLAVLGQMAGSVGHELRNPLAVINNAIYYLKLLGVTSNEKVKQYLGIIETETHNSEKIISDLLDFARAKSVELEPVSVSALIYQVLERFPVPTSVQTTLEIPPDLPQVFVDPLQITQVLGNLTVNACQAMKDGGKLTFEFHQREKMIAIAVKDTGIGIPPENTSKLFEPLFTTKTIGIGLGLAVSQKLAEANGGRIEVHSELGKGSTFTLYLPMVDS